MHSFQPSRGRIFFEVLLAMGMSASLAGAWMQTHATALLGAAGVAAFYGLIHLFDMRRPKSAVTAEPQLIDFETEVREAVSDVFVPMVAEPMAEAAAEEADAEPEAPRSSSGRRTGGSRKGNGRRAKAPKAEKPIETAPVEEVVTPWPLAEVSEPVETASEEDEFVFEGDDEDLAQPHIQPLFEPEPFVRMPRQGFGRRGRL